MKNTCIKCSNFAIQREIYRDGLLYQQEAICDNCWSTMLAGAEYWRHEFNVLLDQGVSRAQANRILIARIDGKELIK